MSPRNPAQAETRAVCVRARVNLQKVETEIAEVRSSIDSDISAPASRTERSA